MVVCLVGSAALVLRGRFVSDRAMRHVTSVGGSVQCGTMLGHTANIGSRSITRSLGSPPVIRSILGWKYCSVPADICLVDLSECRLTIADCRTISAVHNCVLLSLKDASLPADGLADLVAVRTLKIVDLRGVLLSREIFEVLRQNRNLRAVILSSSLVDSADVEEFIRFRPNCEVDQE